MVFTFLSVLAIQARIQEDISESPARVIIIAIDGTITGTGESSIKFSYNTETIGVGNLVNAVPENTTICKRLKRNKLFRFEAKRRMLRLG